MSYNYLFKVIVTGEQNSGKTSLVRRISDDNFRDYTDTTIGVEFVSVEREIGGQRIKYHFWDTAGQESFAPIIKNFRAIIIVPCDCSWLLNRYMSANFNWLSGNSKRNGAVVIA